MKHACQTPVVVALVFTWWSGACTKTPSHRPLVIGHPAPLTSTNIHAPGHNRNAYNILTNVYETLVERGPDMSLRPLLAESWYNPDSLTWVFKLRPGIKRHDGQILTPREVVASIERSLKEPWSRGALASVSAVKARGDEVVFTTAEPLDTFPARLVNLLISAGSEAGGATGPYQVQSWTPNGSVVLDVFKEYRGGSAAIERVEFRIIADPQERARRLIEGGVQLIEEIAPEDMGRLGTAVGVKSVAVPGFLTAFLAFDTSRKQTPYITGRNPFIDPRVREAIHLAVDRGALVAGPLKGYADVTEQLAQAGQIGFDAGLVPAISDPVRARELLKAAGYSKGFDVPLDFIRGVVNEAAKMLVTQLAAVSIQVTPRGAAPPQFLPRVEGEDTSFYLLRWIQPRETQETYNWLLHTKGKGAGTMNGGGYSNARLDALLENAAHSKDESIRAAALREASVIIHQERPILPLYVQKDLYAFSSDLDFEPLPRQQFSTALRRMRWKD